MSLNACEAYILQVYTFYLRCKRLGISRVNGWCTHYLKHTECIARLLYSVNMKSA